MVKKFQEFRNGGSEKRVGDFNGLGKVKKKEETPIYRVWRNSEQNEKFRKSCVAFRLLTLTRGHCVQKKWRS
jgi:hypothetical protein